MLMPKLRKRRQFRSLPDHERMVVRAGDRTDKGSVMTNITVKIKGADAQYSQGAFRAGLLTGILMVPTGYDFRHRRRGKK